MAFRLAPWLPLALCLAVPLRAADRAPDPVGDFALLESARAAYDAGDWAAAHERYARLVTLDPANPALWDRLARSARRLDRHDEALAAMTRAQELGFVHGPNLSYEIARDRMRLGDREGALTWLDRALVAGTDRRARLRSDEVWQELRADEGFRRRAGIPPERLTRDDGWRFDLDYLVEEVRRVHVGDGRPGPRSLAAVHDAFERAVAALRARVPELDDDAVVLGIERALALLGDGHSGIYGVRDQSPARVERRRLPLRFYDFADGLHVIEASERWRDLVGARVLSFGARPAEEIVREIAKFRAGDNAMTMRWLGPLFYLPSLRHLIGLGVADAGGVDLAIRDRAGAVRTVRVAPEEGFAPRRKMVSPPGVEPPLWLSRVDTNYWSRPLPEIAAVYFQINQLRDAESGPSIAEFVEGLRHELVASGAKNLIVDLRHNNGGNNRLTFPIVRAAVAFELAGAGRRIWVITARDTFSAAQNLLNRLERWTSPVVVGEPSSSRPNFVGEDTELELPWSGVLGSISSRYWQDSDPGDDRPWIAPAIPIALTAADYLAGRDPVLEALERILRPAGGSSSAAAPAPTAPR